MKLDKFSTVESKEIAEINGVATLLVHEKTGAELLYVKNDDENKVFGVSFPTPPTDSTGLPHIMEHSVLCGSKNYPLKDPFVELLKGSLNTFLNAFTYPDKTCYPVASQNHKDFINLMRVYLDAVFYPLIPEEVLKQEGWHYELDDVNEPLEYKGVVFNEMKGVYSDPVDMVYEYAQESLFPDTVYSLSSGGDPKVIPDLTYQQFKEFHETFYHPSNAKIYLYGDVNEQECVAVIEEYLSQFDKKDLSIEVPIQQVIPEFRKEIKEYDAGGGDEAKTCMLTLNWLMPEVAALNERMALTTLNYILLGSSASPLKKALIDSALGESLIGGGLHAELRQLYFSTGLKGIKEESADAVQKLVEETLSNLVAEGISQEMIDAAINVIEFSYRENNTGGFPRGLALMLRALNTWLYGHDPLEQFQYEDALSSLKANASAGGYFEGLIQKYLLDNKHRTRVLHVPKEGVAAAQEEAEKKKLADIKAKMSDEELQRVVQETQALKAFQEELSNPDDLAKLPSLEIEDLDRENKITPTEVKTVEETTFLTHDLHTNGICYLDFAFDLGKLPYEYVPILPIYARALFEMGTKKHSFVEISQLMDKETGGIGGSIFLTNQPGSDEALRKLIVRAKAVVDKVPSMLDITKEILLEVTFDNKERFLQLVKQRKAGLEANVVSSGHRLMALRAQSVWNQASQVSEQTSGISQIHAIRELEKQVESNWTGVLEMLLDMHRYIMARDVLQVNCTLDDENYVSTEPHISAFLEAFPSSDSAAASWPQPEKLKHEAFVIPAMVHYVSKACNIFETGYKAHGSLLAINNLINSSYMWEKVRVQGGAYGGFVSYNRHSGMYVCTSYRDPNFKDTLKIYDALGSFLTNWAPSDDEVRKGIIGAIGSMDSHELPDAKGYSAFVRHLMGVAEESFQQLRDEIFETDKKRVKEFGECLRDYASKGTVAVLGPEKSFADLGDEYRVSTVF